MVVRWGRCPHHTAPKSHCFSASCRGVLRRELFPDITKQFGNFGVNIIKLGKQSIELNKEQDQKILNYFDKIKFYRYGCKMEIINGESNSFWTRFLLKVFHHMGTHQHDYIAKQYNHVDALQ